MKLTRLFPVLFLGLSIIACNNDDDGTETEPPRDVNEVRVENNDSIVAFLQTHFYNYSEFQNPPADFDYQIRFDTITDANRDTVIPLIDQVVTREYDFEEVPHTLYVLIVREGVGEKPMLGHSVLHEYEGSLLNGEVFDQSFIPKLSPTLRVSADGFSVSAGGAFIEGFNRIFQELGAGSGYVDNPDGTITWNQDYGIGAVFMPSGLGYFNSSRTSIPAYSPLIFKVDLFGFEEEDQDLRLIGSQVDYIPDGIPSHLEDVDGDGDPRNDDTDEDGLANFADPDDDGDGVLTEYEYDTNGDGIPDDYNNDGIPDYLDPSYPTVGSNS